MTRSISIGAILIPFQTLDVVGPMDILFNISKPIVTTYSQILPDSVSKSALDQSPDIQFHYIGPTMDPVALTANFHSQPTCTVDNCPKLDYLIIGGTEPEYALNMPAPVRKFLIDRCKEVKGVFTACTGGLVLSVTGVLDGLNVTTNHAFIGFGDKMAPKVKWQKKPMWVVDKDANGVEFWTAAGAVAGMDMMAEWIRKEFGQDLCNVTTMVLEYGPRDVTGKPVDFMNGGGRVVKMA